MSKVDMDKFWPDVLESGWVAPSEVLKEAGAQLTKVTEGKIIGCTDTTGDITSKSNTCLSLRVPQLENFALSILTVSHRIPFYPLDMEIHVETGKKVSIGDENELKKELKLALSSPSMAGVISSILALLQTK